MAWASRLRMLGFRTLSPRLSHSADPQPQFSPRTPLSISCWVAGTQDASATAPVLLPGFSLCLSFSGVRAPRFGSLCRGVWGSLRTEPELLAFGKSYNFALVHSPVPRVDAAMEPRTDGTLFRGGSVARMSSWPSHWAPNRSAGNRSAGNGSAPAHEAGAAEPQVP